MRTTELIDRLAADLEPRRPGAALRRLAAGGAIGVGVAALAILAWLGTPLGEIGRTGIPAFTMKLLFGVAMSGIATVLLFMSGRPGQRIGRRLLWLLLPPLVVASRAVMELASLSADMRITAFFGSTWLTCLVAISAIAVPVYLGIVWGLGRLAPTSLRLTGLLAGVAAGSIAAVLYALYCPETTAMFLISWYGLAILAAGLAGAIAGPRLLRW